MNVRTGLLTATVTLTVAAAGSGVPASAAMTSGIPRTAVAAVSLPADQSGEGQWWFTSWNIGKVWEAGARGQGVTVAVIDSGVQADRPELTGVVLPGTDSHGGDGRTDTDTEKGGHGTGMAIFIAGQGGGKADLTGIAPEAKILPVNRLTGNGTADNIRWAADHGAKVINMSYAEYGGGCIDRYADAVRYAIDKGAIVVAGSGNDRSISNTSASPADCPGVVAVGAVDSQAQVWEESITGPQLGLAAPGVHAPVVTLDGRLTSVSGTSVSTALVSGVMALVWSKYPNLTNRQVVARVLATTKDLGPPGRDEETGFGLALPYPAITDNIPADAPNPIFDAAQTTTPTPTPTPSATTTTTTSSSGFTGFPLWAVATIATIALALITLIAVAAVTTTRRKQRHPQPTNPTSPTPGPHYPPGYPHPPTPQPPPTPGTPGHQQWPPTGPH